MYFDLYSVCVLKYVQTLIDKALKQASSPKQRRGRCGISLSQYGISESTPTLGEECNHALRKKAMEWEGKL